MPPSSALKAALGKAWSRSLGPIAFYPDLQSLVLTRLPDVHLDQALKRRWRSRHRILTRLGEALDAFHEGTGRREKVAAQLWHEKTVPEAVRRACIGPQDHAWADRVCSAYLAAAASTRDDLVPFGFTHEDLFPRNIVIQGDQIGFLDFENAQVTHCLKDLARLAIGIQKARGIGRPWRRRDRFGFGFDARVLDTLCAGYGLSVRHEAHFAAILLRGCLHNWLHYKSRSGFERTAPRQAAVSARLADRIARALR